ncbi:C4-dicarboxylate transport sensor protein DctB [Pseudooceanicola marinus]|uniref:C4-dicarboxylate transport sensor protein DctB n=1 Tax=Pseudooceanicola marinus TaxID=396013 RepID=A0A1X6ZAS1_9RHOB|nr:ATP-binding protein [Pseudooceanicola marinus]PJE28222.1 sensor histidine kinase [Pseudooceanicola marinus]SLN46378.1 C4-dicarboxylate transport sensor protein DctB [Pseudooceanicola marinus]
MENESPPAGHSGRTISWRARIALALFLVVVIVIMAVTNAMLMQRYTEPTRNRAELRLALFGANIVSELQLNSIVPQLLARDQELIGALNSDDFSTSTLRLMSFLDEISAQGLVLLDEDGRIVAATNRNRLGENHRQSRYFIEAQRSNGTVFSVIPRETGGFSFVYSRRIDFQGSLIGVIMVEADLAKFERSWAGISDALLVKDSEGRIILSTEPLWRGLTEDQAVARETPSSAIERALYATTDWTTEVDGYLEGEAVMRVGSRIPFRGWQVVSYTSYQSVREQVNGVLALEIMGFAILLALAFYALSRKTMLRLSVFQRESADLRALNERLQREIAERERMEKNLEVAEQTIAQSQKLAALGEMSAAVAHELNQPLAAMKTYLAGAQLLLKRARPDEALASFSRIDDLIGRMGAITRQLKSYARTGGDGFTPVNVGDALASSLSMMEPQLRQRRVRITRALPERPVMVMADRVRLEQVMINLLKNALDATANVEDAKIDILLSAGETATLTVRDNGEGIQDLDALFEPFYTTKQPGDGTGLGLAISSGIIADLGGRLTARNAEAGGAVFEVQLPILSDEIEAAE